MARQVKKKPAPAAPAGRFGRLFRGTARAGVRTWAIRLLVGLPGLVVIWVASYGVHKKIFTNNQI